jgi:sugar phosphate isomerase/epimerase
MPKPIALQLYSLRDDLARGYASVIEKVARMGYLGVETHRFPGTTPQAAAQVFRDLGLTVTSAHAPMPLGDTINESLDIMGALGCTRLVFAYLPPERFKTVDSIRGACDEINAANEAARANGWTLLYHNHWAEYQRVHGRPAYQIMLEHLAPTVQLELDTYWIQTGGCDPVAVLREMGKRAPLVHIKDGPATVEANMVAVGDGVMDWQSIIRAAEESADWLIVELDRCASDMLTAVQRSYTYLTQKGFARGRQS